MSSTYDEDKSLLAKLDEVVPAPLAQFDAFPKLPSSFKSRSESRGFMTLFVGFLAFLLMLNDIGEFIWGWPDHEFSVDRDPSSFMNINVDMVVNMPCRYISVDLRDAIGDRLFLSGHGLRRDGTKFDVGQATKLKEHSEALSVQQAISQSRNSRGFFDTIFRRTPTNLFKPTYNYEAHGSACRVWGTLEVKRVTANLHITTLGHGYASHEHVDHKLMNLSHVISEFSFVTHDPFVAYQYFLHVVPTTYIATRSKPLHTHQYSVTHYTRVLQHNRGTPGIFFKFDLDPMSLTIHQRTTTFAQLLIRCVGVVGGSVEVVAGADDPGLVAAEASGAKIGKGLRAKWGGGEIRSRSKILFDIHRYTPDFLRPTHHTLRRPALARTLGTPNFSTPSFGPSSPRPYAVPPPPSRGMRTPSLGTDSGVTGSPLINQTSFSPSLPGAPTYSMFPPTPNPEAGGFPTSAPPRKVSSGPKKDD
ncbi:DUF1692-domain-containing protein [Armillaria mellea]|nr:DUF1692-domain-containing protein [Armillaria mellea]